MNLEERVTELERRLNERDELENTKDLRIDTYSRQNQRYFQVTNLRTGKRVDGINKLEAIREARR